MADDFSSLRSPVKNRFDASLNIKECGLSSNKAATPEKLIPEKSPMAQLPKISMAEKSRSGPVTLSPTNDDDFQHSINSTPLSHKENLIPVKQTRGADASINNVSDTSLMDVDMDTTGGLLYRGLGTPEPNSRKSVEDTSLELRTPYMNKTRNNSLMLNASPIPDLTPPPESKTKSRIYESVNSPSSFTSGTKRATSTPISLTKVSSAPGSGHRSQVTVSSGIRKVSSPGLKNIATPGLKRRTSSTFLRRQPSSAILESNPLKKQFKSPLKSLSISTTCSPLKKTSRSIGTMKEFSKSNETAAKLYNISKQMATETEEIQKKNSILTSYKNLKLNNPKTGEKDKKLIEKWLTITQTASETLLALYQRKILEKHGSFREYKLSKYDAFRRSLRWKLLNAIDDKFNEMKENENFARLSEYEKKSIEKDYQQAKASTLNDFNRQCDIRFKEMFKDDIAKTRSPEPDTSSPIFVKHANSANDVLDEYEMKDLYKDLKLDFSLIYGDRK